jgi:hypothetical protein
MIPSEERLRIAIPIVAGALGIVALFGAVASMYFGWHLGVNGDSDQVAATNDVIAALSLVLALIAAVIAVLAYLASSGRPKLSAKFMFWNAHDKQPVVWASPPDADNYRRKSPGHKSGLGEVWLVNSSQYAARHPGVKVRLEGVWGLGIPEDPPGWTILDFQHQKGAVELMWDGGADTIIHGEWEHKIGTLNLCNVEFEGRPALIVTVVADGVPPREERFEIKLVTFPSDTH